MKFIQQRDGVKFSYTRVQHDDGSYLFLYDPEVGETYTLDTFGAIIWEMAEQEISLVAVVHEIIDVFEGQNLNLETVRDDVNRIVKILCQRKLFIEREV